MPNENYSNEIDPAQNTRTQFEAARDALDAALKEEEQDRIAAVATNTTAIASEVTRATEAEEALASGLATEQSRAEGVEDDLTDSIAVLTSVQGDTTADLAGLTSTVDAVQTRIAVSLEVGGALKANTVGASQITDASVGAAELGANSVTTAKIADLNVTGPKFALGAVGGTNIASTALSTPNNLWDPFNALYDPGMDFDGVQRWFNPAAISIVDPDTANPNGGRTFRFDPGVGVGAKLFPLSELNAITGNVLHFAFYGMAASGTWHLAGRFYTSADATVGSQIDGSTVTMAGAAQDMLLDATVPATAAYIAVYPVRNTGSATIDNYEWRGSKDVSYLPARASRTASDASESSQRTINGIAWDALFTNVAPGTDFDGRTRWLNSSVLSIVTDANNIYGGHTIEQAYSVGTALAGKWFYFDEMHAAVNDTLTFTAQVYATSGTYRLAMRFYDVSSAAVGSQISGSIKTPASTTIPITVKGKVPATATKVLVYVIRASGTAVIHWYSLTGRLTSPRGATHPAANPSDWQAEIKAARNGQADLLAGMTALSSTAVAFPTSQSEYGRHFLVRTHAQIAKLRRGSTATRFKFVLLGDSWADNGYIFNAIYKKLIDTFATVGVSGSAGVGWISFSPNMTVPAITISGIAAAHGGTGTWTARENNDTPPGYSIDIGSVYETTIGYSKTATAYLTDGRICYRMQSGGGSFRWKVDAGAWSSDVSTDGATAYASLAIPTQSAGSHTVTVEITVAGTGVEVSGLLNWIDTSGITGYKFGNGGARADQYAGINATFWQAALADIDPDLIIILLGTNDDTQEVNPTTTFKTSIETIIDRIRAAGTSDIMLLSPTANGFAVGTYALSEYVTVLRSVAVSKGVAMKDAYADMPSYSVANALGLMTNTTHQNADGGQMTGDGVVPMILGT